MKNDSGNSENDMVGGSIRQLNNNIELIGTIGATFKTDFDNIKSMLTLFNEKHKVENLNGHTILDIENHKIQFFFNEDGIFLGIYNYKQ